MPLAIIDAFPSGQAVINTDDIVTIKLNEGTPEVFLRGVDEPVRLPHATVADVVVALDDPDNRCLIGEAPVS